MASSWGVKTDRLPGKEHYVTKIDNGDWIRVREVDFGSESPTHVTIRVLNFKNSGLVEFYIDSLGGNPFASFNVTADQVITSEVLRSVSGKHDVYILFRGGDGQMFDLDWWQAR